MSATKINVNGVEFELNLLDADVVEKYEHLNKEITRKIQDTKAYEGKTTAEGMRYQCRCVEEYFDKLFGNGTSAKIFPKNNDLGIRMDAMAMLHLSQPTSRSLILQTSIPLREHRTVPRDVQLRKTRTNSMPLIVNEYAH